MRVCAAFRSCLQFRRRPSAQLPGFAALLDHPQQPLGCLVFVIAAFAEAARLPFDLPECEQELIGGYHTEYAGIKLLLFLVAEFIHMITASFLIVILFLGGWHFWGITGADPVATSWGRRLL